MRRKIVGAALLVALAVAAGWNFNQSKNETELSELMLENIDALARGEGGPDWNHHKLVYKPNGCCDDDPYLDCSGSYNHC